jgi:hypothetical protein
LASTSLDDDEEDGEAEGAEDDAAGA